MAQIIEMSLGSNKVIDITEITRSRNMLLSGMIAPADEDTTYQIANEHTSEPIKSIDEDRKSVV